MGMVKRRASTMTMTTVIKYNELKKTFLQDIKHSMLMDEIQPELVIKWALILAWSNFISTLWLTSIDVANAIENTPISDQHSVFVGKPLWSWTADLCNGTNFIIQC